MTKSNLAISSIQQAMRETGQVWHDERMHSEHFLRPLDGWDFYLNDGRVLRVWAESDEWESGVDVLLFNDATIWAPEREMRHVVGVTAEGWKLVLKGMIA